MKSGWLYPKIKHTTATAHELTILCAKLAKKSSPKIKTRPQKGKGFVQYSHMVHTDKERNRRYRNEHPRRKVARSELG